MGLAVTIISAAYSLAPPNWPKIPSWLLLGGVIAGTFLLGIAGGLFCSTIVSNTSIISEMPQVIETHLFLQFSSSSTIPIEKNPKNIKYWYALYTESIFVDTKDKDGKSVGGFSIPARWNIFIIFDKPPLFRQLIVTCTGPNSPTCNTQASNSAYAIISTKGEMTNAVMDISLQ